MMWLWFARRLAMLALSVLVPSNAVLLPPQPHATVYVETFQDPMPASP